MKKTNNHGFTAEEINRRNPLYKADPKSKTKTKTKTKKQGKENAE